MSVLKDLPNKTVIMPIGLPASGKSTFYNYLKERFGERLSLVSFDDAVMAWADKKGCSYAQAYDDNKNDPIAKRFINTNYDRQWEKAQSSDGIVFIDQTHISKKTRDRHFAKLEGFYKVGLYFDITLEESLKRCHERFMRTGKDVPAPAVRSMFNMLASDKHKPQAYEFDLFMVVDTKIKVPSHASPVIAIKQIHYR